MRTLLKMIVTLAVLLGIALGVYYFYRRGQAREQGESYSLARAPGDLVREVRSLFDSGDSGDSGSEEPEASAAEHPPSGEPESGEEESPGAEPESAGSDGGAAVAERFPEARDLYRAGHYEEAIPLLYEALAVPGSTGERPRELLARARLFLLLLEGAPSGEALSGPAVARIRTARGDPMIVTVKDETPTEIEFEGEGGVGARVPKADLKEVTVARTPAARKTLFEEEYRRRHDDAKTAAGMIDLARFCRRTGLTDHLTYLLERALEQPGDEIQARVAREHAAAERAGASDRVALTADLLQHFWSRGEYTMRALANASTPRRPGVRVEPGDDTSSSGNGPPSGIGGTARLTPRTANAEVDALLEKADKLRSEADAHYMQAQPGSPDRAEHREKAIDGYRKAMAIYEQVEEKWDVGLESTFRELQLRLYQMMKDETLK